MKLSTKTTYGLRALIRLAAETDDKPVSVATIAQEEDLSPAYLERIMAVLRRKKLVRASKGAAGGYELALPASELSVGLVVRALEGWGNLFQCVKKIDDRRCSESCTCTADQALLAVENRLNGLLNEISIQELAKIKKE